MKIIATTIVAIIVIFLCHAKGYGFEINDTFSISGVLAGGYQHQDIADAP